MRKTEFANGEFYHIYNRGVDKREVFSDKFDYERFLKSMKEFNRIEPIGSLYEKSFKDAKLTLLESKSPIGDLDSKSSKSIPIVEFVCYCLNPNHYHFIIKQIIRPVAF